MRERDEDVFLGAGAIGHVLLLVVELVVAALRASDQLGERVVLANHGRGFSDRGKDFTAFTAQNLQSNFFTIPEMSARGLV